MSGSKGQDDYNDGPWNLGWVKVNNKVHLSHLQEYSVGLKIATEDFKSIKAIIILDIISTSLHL